VRKKFTSLGLGLKQFLTDGTIRETKISVEQPC
jgi:hypothetical protein